MSEYQISKPQRSHKSKKEQKRKSSVRVFGGGFIERSRRPQVHGEESKSRIIRVDADFAEYIRDVAKREGKSITDMTRALYLELIGE